MVVDETNAVADGAPSKVLLVPNKNIVGPHERLHVLLVSPFAGRDAFVTLSDGHMRSAFVLHLTGSERTFDVMPPVDDAHFSIDATIAGY